MLPIWSAAMLLNQFNTTLIEAGLRSAASSLQAGTSRKRNSFLVAMKKSKSLQVRASSSASSSGSSEGGKAGWLKSSIARKMTSKVANVADTVRQYVDGRSDIETVQYNGIATVMKKLKVLGLDAAPDAEDDASEFEGKNVSIQLVSNEIDPETGKTLVSNASIFQRWDESSDIATENLKFKLQFSVPRKFGLPCAILVKNNHPNEFLLLSFSLDHPDSKKDTHFWANSWVANTSNSDGRCFFLNKAYLPSDTPDTLKEYREKELRGNGKGTRKPGERVYDYDVYNDLGNPDKDPALTRRTLGGSADFSFPRRL